MLQGPAYPETVRPRWPAWDGMGCREQSDVPGGGSATVLEDEDEARRDLEKSLRCAVCRSAVTTVRERFSRGGKHLHTFFNPAGIVYEIGCFRSAPGCLAHGASSTEFSWFSGYSWRVVYCRECFEHLGWFFSGSADAFYGLIVSRLVEE